MTEEIIGSDWTATTVRVRYAETDQMGVVYYANYLVWFEIGRTDFCSQHGFAYRDMEQEDGLYIMVAEARCRYKAPARYDEEILIRTRLTGMRKRVLIFGYEVYKQRTDELIAEGETVHVITDRDGRPRTLPEKYRELLLGRAETGKAKTEVRESKFETRNLKLEIRKSNFRIGKWPSTAVILSEAKNLCSYVVSRTSEILPFALAKITSFPRKRESIVF